MRRRLAGSGLILAMLLVVTVLADMISSPLTANALLNEGTRLGRNANSLLIWAQRALILLALLFGLLGWGQALRRLSVVIIGLVTLSLLISVVVLVVTFPHQPQGDVATLLSDGLMLWLMTVLVFSAWYWLLDTGGHLRAEAPPAGRRHLLFPQHASSLPGWEDWRPDPIDYLFLAFNTSTAFSPTDTLILTRRVKLLMMAQALIALVIMAVILARAINAIQ